MVMKGKKCAHTRRAFLGMSGAAFLSSAVPCDFALAAQPNSHGASAEYALLRRVLGSKSRQFHLAPLHQSAVEGFRISGTSGRILVEGSTPSARMMGVNWYLKYVAGVSTNWNGNCLDKLPAILPAPASPIVEQAYVKHRFALNDTNDGYTGPYWTWDEWERLIDVLALHGINEVLIYMGAEAVYQQTFRNFGYSTEELRSWFPTPAHQPWFLLENMSGWVGPSVSQQLIDARVALAAKITQRVRDLGMTPVLPGYYGIVPDGFADRNLGAHIFPQGKWLGMKRPDWLDPLSGIFARVADAYYGAQEKLLGPSSMFKMDPLHEGGKASGLDLTRVSQGIHAALQKAHPGAVWAILGWQENPKRELLAGIKNRNQALILDGLSDRYAYQDREQQWDHTPYAFGAIWNFGGHTAIGANIGVWNERYFSQREKSGSQLDGIAIMPEASCNNPAAFAFLSEIAWRRKRPNLAEWFAAWSGYRYGGNDAQARQAWDVLRATAYDGKSGEWSEPHDNLFGAQPDLEAKSACSWSPEEPRYDLAVFSQAIEHLLQVEPDLRTSSAYRYDLVDVARQTISNRSRVMLPKIRDAYAEKDLQRFRQLTKQWLEHISLLNRVTGTDRAFMLGPWLSAAKAMAASPAENAQLEFDARSVLVEWGPRASRDSGVHDYANREWNGLLEFYRERWARYFSMLEASLEKQQTVTAIDWFAMDEEWSRQTHNFIEHAQEDAYQVVRAAMQPGF